MKTNYLKSYLSIYFLFQILCCYQLFSFNHKIDPKDEKKVDYLERIYFSGKNKEDLNTMILVTLQELEGKESSLAVAKQYSFLYSVKDIANQQENACDVLDIIAAGIYNIDAQEGIDQEVLKPSDKAKKITLEPLNKLNSTFSSISNNSLNNAWSTYVLTGGNIGATNTALKVGAIAGKAGAVTNTVSQGAQVYTQGKELIKGLGLGGGNKPCKKVPQKNIEIGDHGFQQKEQAKAVAQEYEMAVANNTTTKISIPGISYAQLRSLKDALAERKDVTSIEKEYNESLSSITLSHNGSADSLADWLVDKFGSTYQISDVNNKNGTITLVLKSAKK